MYYTFRITGQEGASTFVNYDVDGWCPEPRDAGKWVKILQDRYKNFPQLTNIKITYKEDK